MRPNAYCSEPAKPHLSGAIITESANLHAADELTSDEADAVLREILGNERVTAEPDAVRDLITACARSPLALRIVAAHTAARPNVTVADAVEELTAGHRQPDTANNTDDHHGAVRTVLDWAYSRLPLDHARTLRRLGVHPGPELDVHAAATLAEADLSTARQHLEALAGLGLIDKVGDHRYRLHDLVHGYAAQRADQDDIPEDRHRARTAVLTWYAHVARAADRLLFPGLLYLDVELHPVDITIVLDDRRHALAWFDDELTNLVAALHTAEQHHLYGVTVGLASTMRFLVLRNRSLWTVRAEAETLGLTAARANHDRATEALLLGFRGETLTYLGRLGEAESDFLAQLDLARELSDPTQERFGLCGLGFIRFNQQRYLDAEEYYLQALPLAHHATDRRPEAVVECNLSQICARLEQYDQALRHAERELLLRRESPDRVGEAYALHDVAVAWQGLENHAKALKFADDAIAMYRTLDGTEIYMATALETASISLQRNGNSISAAEYLQEALTIFTKLETPLSQDMSDRLRTLENSEAGETGQ